jgi:hypothetical protein
MVLTQLISESLAASGNAAVETAVFGTGDPAEIAGMIGRFCTRELGVPLRDAFVYGASVGCVVGLRLDDDSEVVVKAFQPRWTGLFLGSVHSVQQHLAFAGFPCPRPILGPRRLGRTLALVESYLPDPGLTRVEPSMLTVSAAGLAVQIGLCAGLDGVGLADHPLNAATEGLFPEPHSPVFDFAATATGAEWIDAFAVRARAQRDRDPGEPVIAHTDWSAWNVRFDCERVLAVYDWDSLALVPESTAVGQAAATWSSTPAPGERAPSLTEMVGYVRAYEAARGRPFSAGEHRAIGGAVVWVLAYASRCEHAIDPHSELHRRARPRLAADGEALLALADLLA